MRCTATLPKVQVMDSPTTTDPSSDPQGAIARWCGDESGVTAIEYGLLAALIVVACIGAFSLTGASLTAVYNAWSSAVLGAL